MKGTIENIEYSMIMDSNDSIVFTEEKSINEICLFMLGFNILF